MGFYTSHFIWHTFAHCLGGMTACASFIGGGVFDRFPRLRAGFLEANCSWAPWLIERLEDHFDDYDGRYLLSLEREVPEYFVDNCFVSAESGERALRHYIAEFGDDNVVFSTDYPHADCKFPHAVDRFLTLPISEDSKRKILWDNCARLYDLDPVSGTAVPVHGVAQ